jgi:CRISPR system Cascade subunit CasA
VTESFARWFGGLKVSSNAGEQYVSGGDDFVESRVRLRSAMLGEAWFVQLKTEMDDLDTLAKGLYGRIMSFFKELKADGGRIAAQASHLFWQLCERDFQGLVDSCAQDESSNAQRQRVRRQFAGYVQQVYDQFCPKETARQLDSWAKCRPNNSKYLKQEA